MNEREKPPLRVEVFEASAYAYSTFRGDKTSSGLQFSIRRTDRFLPRAPGRRASIFDGSAAAVDGRVGRLRIWGFLAR
jgi:hypothetical protein